MVVWTFLINMLLFCLLLCETKDKHDNTTKCLHNDKFYENKLVCCGGCSRSREMYTTKNAQKTLAVAHWHTSGGQVRFVASFS